MEVIPNNSVIIKYKQVLIDATLCLFVHTMRQPFGPDVSFLVCPPLLQGQSLQERSLPHVIPWLLPHAAQCLTLCLVGLVKKRLFV